jgi:putative ABC transport system permease protein
MCVSFRQVMRHRHRYLGVVLAISLGVAGFITVVTMSRDIKKNFNKDLTLIGGATVIRMYFENDPDQRPQWFRDNAIEAVRRIPGVQDLSLASYGQGRSPLPGTGHKYQFMVFGVEEPFWEIHGFWPLKGRLINAADVSERRREVVIGPELAKKLYGPENGQVQGSLLEIGQDLYEVAGVLGGLGDSSYNNAAFLPLSTAQDRITQISLPNRLYIRCATWDDVANVAKALPMAVRTFQAADGLRVEVFWERLKRVQKLAWWIEFLVYLAITATLVLGGVGIWNVMMAAVRSRTREIGLKKAMGAQDKDILAQFLSEALCLSGAAALVGAGLGRLLMEITGAWIGSRPPENLFFMGLCMGFAFALILGVGAGLYPSLRASRMEVVSAIRYE